jgi:hypothetical protein
VFFFVLTSRRFLGMRNLYLEVGLARTASLFYFISIASRTKPTSASYINRKGFA